MYKVVSKGVPKLSDKSVSHETALQNWGDIGPTLWVHGDLVLEDRCDLKKWQVPDQ